jgi:hypothetical protein
MVPWLNTEPRYRGLHSWATENVATGFVLTGKLETRGLRFAEDGKLVGISCSALAATDIHRHPGGVLFLCRAARVSTSVDKVLEREPLSSDLFPNWSIDELRHHARGRIWTWIAGYLDRHFRNHPLS